MIINFYGVVNTMNNTNNLAKRWCIKNDELPLYQHKNCLHKPLIKKLGEGSSNIHKIDDDLTYIETEYKPSKDLAILNKTNNQESRLVVTLGLKGHSRFSSQCGEEIIFNQGYTSITTFDSSIGERQFEANKHILQLRFSMNKNWLQRYFDETKTSQLFKNKNVQIISHKPITTQGLVIAQQIHSCKTPSDIKKLFIHGYAITLIASELDHLFSSDCEKAKKFSHKDKKIANTARDILYQEFNNPPSVEQLSIRAGTNQFKLKKLFHHFFNNTPYGVLLEIRMNKAYHLLESSHCHVNIAANFVGYHHASNFSTAFIKFFGVSPKNISKRY